MAYHPLVDAVVVVSVQTIGFTNHKIVVSLQNRVFCCFENKVYYLRAFS